MRHGFQRSLTFQSRVLRTPKEARLWKVGHYHPYDPASEKSLRAPQRRSDVARDGIRAKIVAMVILRLP